MPEKKLATSYKLVSKALKSETSPCPDALCHLLQMHSRKKKLKKSSIKKLLAVFLKSLSYHLDLVADSIDDWFPHLVKLRVECQKFIQTLCDKWSSNLHIDQKVKFFLILYRLAKYQSSLTANILKIMYKSFSRNLKDFLSSHYSVSAARLKAIIFLYNGICEIINLNFNPSRKFIVKVLGNLMRIVNQRLTTTKKAKESTEKDPIINWATVFDMKIIGTIMKQQPADPVDPNDSSFLLLLKPIYSQLMHAILLYEQNNPKYFSFHLQMISLIASTFPSDHYFPVIPFIFDIIKHAFGEQEGKRIPKGKGKGKGKRPMINNKMVAKFFNFPLMIKVDREEASSKDYRDAIMEECVHFFLEIVVSQSQHPSFPELISEPINVLKKISKNSFQHNHKVFSVIASKLEAHGEKIKNARSNMAMSPADCSLIPCNNDDSNDNSNSNGNNNSNTNPNNSNNNELKALLEHQKRVRQQKLEMATKNTCDSDKDKDKDKKASTLSKSVKSKNNENNKKENDSDNDNDSYSDSYSDSDDGKNINKNEKNKRNNMNKNNKDKRINGNDNRNTKKEKTFNSKVVISSSSSSSFSSKNKKPSSLYRHDNDQGDRLEDLVVSD